MTIRKRNIRISVRLNRQEHRMLKEKCRQSGMTIEGLVRGLIEGCEIRPRPPDSYRDLARELAAIGNNINQITHLANSTGYVSRTQIERLASLMARVWQLVQERV